MFKPTPDHSIRASYNRAFRVAVGDQQLPRPEHLARDGGPRPLGRRWRRRCGRSIPPEPFFLIVNNFGNPDLKEQRRRVRGRLHGHVRREDHGGPRRLPERHRQQHQLHDALPRREPAGLPRPRVLRVGEPGAGHRRVPRPRRPAAPVNPGLSPILMGALAQMPPPFGGRSCCPTRSRPT